MANGLGCADRGPGIDVLGSGQMATKPPVSDTLTDDARVSIVVVAFNSGALLVECMIRALGSMFPLEVFVSDNGSYDGSIDVVEYLARSDNRLHILRNGHNLGFAAANNRALALAPGRYVLFLNPDCLLQPDTIDRMVEALEIHPDAGMAGCLIRNPDGSEERSCRRESPTPRSLFGQLLGGNREEARPVPTEPIAVEAISGAFMLVRKVDLERIGSFDEGYFLHWEDVDLCRRFRDAGRNILFVPDVEVLHFKGRSSRKRPVWVEWQKHRGLIRYFRKFHFPSWPAPFYWPVAAAIGLRFLIRAAAPGVRTSAEPPMAVNLPSSDRESEAWVFGATSIVGGYLLPRLLAAGYQVRAFCKDPTKANIGVSPRLTLHALDMRGPGVLAMDGSPSIVINLAPIDALPGLLPALAQRGVRDVIAFSSTSVVTKADSTEASERHLARSLLEAEAAVGQACESAGMRWCILRPTMIYAFGLDQNVSRLARIIRRLRFFPLPGKGSGLRQPVHADDLARACVQLILCGMGWNRIYTLSGGEVLTYRAMLEAIFRKMGRPPRIVQLPEYFLRATTAIARRLPGFRDVNTAMMKRTDTDLCFPHEEATRAFGYSPRRFLP